MTDTDRLARREAAPALMRLHRALSRLNGVLVVMNTGAHPDDEQSGLLAWLRFGLGHRVVVACSTRGEGGQNALGAERGALLGVLRTREMEEAAKVLDCDVAWLGFGPDDPVHDFGFSKDGDDTFARWGQTLITDRLACAYRRYRPDIVIPTFLDVPGQHGHHRAMTRAAHDAIALAADPTKQLAGDLAPWQVSHHYLPAWGGGGGTYDDTLPPPPATLRVTADAVDPATGVSYQEVGQWSRRRHASQGMGHWSDSPQVSWDLHLVGGSSETRLAQGIPATLTELAAIAGPASEMLSSAAQDIARAQNAFPDSAYVIVALALADQAIEQAQSRISHEFAQCHGHRLTRKRREIAYALAEAAALTPVISVHPVELVSGTDAQVHVHQTGPFAAQDVMVQAHFAGAETNPVPLIEGLTQLTVRLSKTPVSPDVFTDRFDPMGGNGDHVSIAAQIAGRQINILRDFETRPQILPSAALNIRPDALVRLKGDMRALAVTLSQDVDINWQVPDGWMLSRAGRRITLTPQDEQAGRVSFTPRIGSDPAVRVIRGEYPHVGPFACHQPLEASVLSLDLTLPADARVAYVGSGDNVGEWLEKLGVDVTHLDDIDDDEDFARFTTVLVGVVAFGNRRDLQAATERLHRFVKTGGHLVTLYQRMDQGWSADTTPPRFLKIGTPSLRWRVTNPTAEVSVLDADHVLLNVPNQITPSDWQGWNKERGLYFAAEWDPCYHPLLAMADTGETPLTGSLITGQIELGRHTHVALNLHHQLDQLVAGAFRLLANLIQPARDRG